MTLREKMLPGMGLVIGTAIKEVASRGAKFSVLPALLDSSPTPQSSTAAHLAVCVLQKLLLVWVYFCHDNGHEHCPEISLHYSVYCC